MMHEPVPKPEKPKICIALIVSAIDGTSVRVGDDGNRLDGETLDAVQTLIEVLTIAATATMMREKKP